MVPWYSLLNIKVIWLYMVPARPPITIGGGGFNFAKILWWQFFFLYLWQDKPLWVELKTDAGVILITILLHFHYFISLEKSNTQKSEVFLLRISLENVNASAVTYRYLISSNFQFQFWKRIFRNSVSVFIWDFKHKFCNTFCEEHSD